MGLVELSTTHSWLNLIAKIEDTKTKNQIVKDKIAKLSTYTEQHLSDTKKVALYYTGVYKI